MKQKPSTEALAHSPGTLLHRQLFLVIREQIISGVYAPGTVIPKEEELCEHFGVSRITVRRAVADLQQLGFVEKRQGRGTFVATDLPFVRPAVSLNVVDALNKTAVETTVKVLSIQRAVPPLAVARQLGLEPNETAMHTVRLRSKKQVPLMVTDAWVVNRFSEKIDRKDLEKTALFQLLMTQGVKFGRVVQELSAVSATPTYAKLLKTDVGAPLLKLIRIVCDQDQLPVEHLTVFVSPDRSRFLMEITGENIDTPTAGHFTHDLYASDAL